MPAPKLPHLGRTFAFVATFVALVVLYHSITGRYSLDNLYRSALRDVVDRLVVARAPVHEYLSGFTLGLRVLVFAVILALARRAAPRRCDG